MEDIIILSNLNDFIFCPASIYFHNLYGSQDKMSYQGEAQLKGSKAHENIDTNRYSTKKNILTGLEVFSEQYGIAGKIDVYDGERLRLIERKKKIKQIYEGQIFQLYGQYFAMIEMGYVIKELQLYSLDDNKKYKIELPENDTEMMKKFEKTIYEMRTFQMESFQQKNVKKCQNCIYEPACDRAAERINDADKYGL